MSKLEELRKTIAEMFENATEKEEIEQLAKVNNAISDVEAEQKDLTEKNAELIKSYKDLVQHTSFKDNVPPAAQTNPAASSSVLSVEDALAQFLENEANK